MTTKVYPGNSNNSFELEDGVTVRVETDDIFQNFNQSDLEDSRLSIKIKKIGTQNLA